MNGEINREIEAVSTSTSQPSAALKRRRILRFGAALTALTGASAISTISAHAVEDTIPPTAYVPVTEKGAPKGVATLDEKSRVPRALLPDLSATYGRASAAEVFAASFGTVGDGKTDDTVPLRAALAASAGKTLVITQMHRLTKSLCPSTALPTNIVFRAGAGLIIGADVVALAHQGTAGLPVAITAGSTAGSPTITVAEASPFALGAHIVLKSADTHPGAANISYRGMLARITAKAGNVLTLDTVVYRDMPSNPQAVPVTLAPRVSIDGGEFTHTSPIGVTGYKSALFTFTLSLGPTITGIDAHNLGGPCLLASHVDGGSFSGNLADLNNDPDNGHFGYGVNLGGTTRYFRVISGTARRVRHGFTTGNGAGPAVVYSVGDPFRNHVSSNFLVTEGKDAGLDTHAQGWGNVLEPNVDGCRIGIQDRAQFTVFRGGVVSGATSYGANISTEAKGTLIDGTNFINTPATAVSVIRAASSTGVLKDVYIPAPPNPVPTVSGTGQVEIRGSSYVPGYNFSRPGTFGLLGKRAIAITATTDVKDVMVGLLGLPPGGSTPLNLNGGVLTTGRVEVTDAAGGIVLKSPNGTRYRITVANGGALTATKI
ncbi:hypothetical protein ACRB8A_14985 [Arthrobacter sp. G.S.26]|uniref:hypothetical protein n=1 Tax=Arthrobacter sp. G.S.26 TaxID=3433706 RepID=UPI003D770292